MTARDPIGSRPAAFASYMLARGIVMALFGVLVLVWPRLAGITFLLLFGVYALVDAATGVAAMVRARRWSGPIGLGVVVSLVAGLVAIAWPAATAVVLVYVVALWAVVAGVFELGVGLLVRRPAPRAWAWVVLAGIVSIALGIVLFANPVAGAVAVVLVIGIFTVLTGLLLIGGAILLRRVPASRTTIEG